MPEATLLYRLEGVEDQQALLRVTSPVAEIDNQLRSSDEFLQIASHTKAGTLYTYITKRCLLYLSIEKDN